METTPILFVPIEQLHPHPHNPRGPVDPESADVLELADSIREKGVLEPLLCVPIRDKGRNWLITGYTVVVGHRRHTAATLAGLTTVPVIQKDYDATEQEEIMLMENLQREDLTPLQEARAFQRLADRGMTYADIRRKTGVGQARIQTVIQLLKLSSAVQEMFGSNQMPITAVPELLKVDNLDRQERLAGLVMSRRLSVPRLAEMVASLRDTDATASQAEKSRPKPVKRPLPVIAAYTRADAVADLEKRNGATLSYADVLKSLEGVCGTCGMKNMPAICTACPLPQFLGNLMKERADASHQK